MRLGYHIERMVIDAPIGGFNEAEAHAPRILSIDIANALGHLALQ